jgi:hypothetical protein
VSRTTTLVARAVLLVFGLLLFVAVGEGALRIIYRDGGTRTLGGPGGRSFDHETVDGVLRGRRDVGPKRPGVPRVMIVGDSITYGLGVREWKATWPERVAEAFENAGRPHEFAVFAEPGNDIPQHLEIVRSSMRSVQPDIFVYQWYVNDLEAISHRPDLRQPWQRWPWHNSLKSASYLYYVLDHRLAQLVSRPHHTYVDYLREFTPGTLEWTEFEREFHEFAVHAMWAPRRLMVLYPQVPFRTTYPLQHVHDLMRRLAGPHTIEIPPIAWVRSAGALVANADAVWRQAVQTTGDDAGLVVQTGDYLFAPGKVDIGFEIAGATADSPGVVELVDVASNTVIATGTLPSAGGAQMHEVHVELVLPGDRVRRLAVRVTSSHHGQWAIADVKLKVDYGFEVLDLTESLNQFNTHASSFDAHPNARAHQVIADQVYAVLNRAQ